MVDGGCGFPARPSGAQETRESPKTPIGCVGRRRVCALGPPVGLQGRLRQVKRANGSTRDAMVGAPGTTPVAALPRRADSGSTVTGDTASGCMGRP